MTTNDQTPEPTPVPAAPYTAPAVPTAYPIGHPHHGHHTSGVAVAVMIVGALFFATIAFGAGFGIRGAIDRHFGFGGARAGRSFGPGMMGQGWGDGYSQGSGFDQGRGCWQGRGGMMRGYRGQDGYQNAVPQDRLDRGQGWTVPQESVPPTAGQ